MTRGAIHWADLEPRRGHEQGSVRPVAIVSADAYNRSAAPLVAVVPLTTARPKHPLHVAITASETGLDRDSTALLDHARFLDRSRLRPQEIGRLSAAAQARIDRNLLRVFGLTAFGG